MAAAEVQQLSEFRSEVRDWLEANCPASMRTPTPEAETVWGGRSQTFLNPDSEIWLERMAERGWTCATWPKEYGGGGLSADENRVLEQELRRMRERDLEGHIPHETDAPSEPEVPGPPTADAEAAAPAPVTGSRDVPGRDIAAVRGHEVFRTSS